DRPHRPPCWVWRRCALHLPVRPSGKVIKPVVPRRFFHQLSLHPFLSLFIFSDVSCLRHLGELQARSPTERYDEASRKNAPATAGYSLVNCLAVGLPLSGDEGCR